MGIRILQLLELIPGLLARAADHDTETGHDLEVIGIAPIALHAHFDVAVKSLCVFQGLMCAKHDVGGLGRKLAPVVRGAGLHDDGLSLRRTRHRERSLDLEELPLMIEHMPPVRLIEAPLLLIEDKGIVVPAVP